MIELEYENVVATGLFPECNDETLKLQKKKFSFQFHLALIGVPLVMGFTSLLGTYGLTAESLTYFWPTFFACFFGFGFTIYLWKKSERITKKYAAVAQELFRRDPARIAHKVMRQGNRIIDFTSLKSHDQPS